MRTFRLVLVFTFLFVGRMVSQTTQTVVTILFAARKELSSMQVLCSEYSCAFAGSDAQMHQLFGLLAEQGISDGVSLAAAGKAMLMLVTSSLSADITVFVCSLAEAFRLCVCFVASSFSVCSASGSRELGSLRCCGDQGVDKPRHFVVHRK